ncbi:N-hydroxyarylamine O-acetyltransferase [Acinetobacter calcoaceticus]|uniref:N-hydroxyarylamine O-acetyltransferase n=1 Tax=Acinetobacter calcoaceticus TaxID=471 RepID=A0A4R1Y252_ACICA|nr:N-hydroxyarylamine O-acetyltransferase [Acinetobacter calcoaceticus]
MSNTMTLSARYLQKIGFDREVQHTHADLQELLIRHIQSIPFGNIAPFLHQTVSLDIEDIAAKLLDQGREGYCHEQNILTKTVLLELGFEAFNLLGRVYYQNMHLHAPPRTHLVTMVKLDQQLYLFDPGFGGMTPTGVLAIDQVNQIQQTPFESFRLIDVKDAGVAPSALSEMKLMLQAYVKETWINIYAFNPEQIAVDADINLANWYVSTSPKSLFTNHLIVSSIQAGQRKSLSNQVLSEHAPTGTRKHPLESEVELKAALENIFQLNTADIDMAALLEKLSTK